MKKLIEALTIFLKYGDKEWPTHCEHDVMTVDINVEDVSEDDIKKLDELGFIPDEDGTFLSYRYGSC